ncbi:MAG TPA: carboxypeptidase regulatory-like domain-containing protein, partial [Pyrinomonadaceae bacterium]
MAALVSALLFGRHGAAQEPVAAGFTPGAARAQQQPPAPPVEGARQTGRVATITGRIVASEGNFAIANALVMARTADAGGASSVRTATTDEEGKFQLTNLRLANYLIRVSAPGYVSEPSSPATVYRPGETVALRMVKGGVITGRVFNPNGEPMVLARVRAVRVRDAEGRPVRDSGTARDWTTDDRGIYRLYGLEAGGYVVAASSTGMFRVAAGQGGEAAPTYYPSATLDAATPVSVNAGDETRDIDIRYRPERSYAVRGMIIARIAPGAASPARTLTSITLSHVATGVAVAYTIGNRAPTEANTYFNFEGVPDGVYELTAQTAPGTSDAAIAPPQRITVRGANVTDIMLTLV